MQARKLLQEVGDGWRAEEGRKIDAWESMRLPWENGRQKWGRKGWILVAPAYTMILSLFLPLFPLPSFPRFHARKTAGSDPRRLIGAAEVSGTVPLPAGCSMGSFDDVGRRLLGLCRLCSSSAYWCCPPSFCLFSQAPSADESANTVAPGRCIWLAFQH